MPLAAAPVTSATQPLRALGYSPAARSEIAAGPRWNRIIGEVRVRDIMVTPVVVASEETTLAELARTMLERRIGGIPIVDGDGALVGIVTETDFVGTRENVPLAFPTAQLPSVFREWVEEDTFERISREARERPAREVMSTPLVIAEEHETVQDVVERMIEHDVGRVPVVRDGKPIGIVSRHDILTIVAGRRPADG